MKRPGAGFMGKAAVRADPGAWNAGPALSGLGSELGGGARE